MPTTGEKITDGTATKPMDLRYMKMIRMFQHLIGSWPHAAFGENIKAPFFRSTGFLAVEWTITLLAGVYYLRTHIGSVSFFELGQTYLTVFLNFIGVQRVLVPWIHRKSYPAVCKSFVCEMHLMHHRHKTKYTEEMYRRIYRICSIFVEFIHAEAVIGIFLFNLVPMYNNFTNGMYSKDRPEGRTFEHAIYYSLPFDHLTSFVGYLSVTLFNLVLSYDCGLAFCGYDIILSVIVFHIWGHLKILDHDLRTFPRPVELRGQTETGQGDELAYTEEENKKVAQMLKDMINHHRMIMGFMTTTSTAFGPTLCLYYMFHQVSGCILLLECSKLDTASLSRYGGLTVTLFHFLIQISVIIELLGSQSETLKDAVYSLPWDCMNTSNRRIVSFLLHNVQTPIALKPMGMVSVGVRTMATIIKTSISYFMLLRTVTIDS